MLSHKLVRLFIANGLSISGLGTYMRYTGSPPVMQTGLNRIEMFGPEGVVAFNMSDLYEYENNKEFYNSKLYKHLAGYNDEET